MIGVTMKDHGIEVAVIRDCKQRVYLLPKTTGNFWVDETNVWSKCPEDSYTVWGFGSDLPVSSVVVNYLGESDFILVG